MKTIRNNAIRPEILEKRKPNYYRKRNIKIDKKGEAGEERRIRDIAKATRKFLIFLDKGLYGEDLK